MIAALAFLAAESVSSPLAHLRFCARHPTQCEAVEGEWIAEAERRRQIARVNAEVNAAIRPRSDPLVRGLRDDWRIGTAPGDCEDYALEKRRRLLALGWSSADLRIAVVLTPDGVGHAVLVAHVGGDMVVLDNLRDRILPLDRTGYRPVKIQSRGDPSAWVAPRP